MYETIELTRQELCEQVWSKPMIQIAAETGVSSTRIREACEQMAVPRPKQGHWTLDKLGRTPRTPPLSKLGKGKVDSVRIYKSGTVRQKRPTLPKLVVPEPADQELPIVQRTRSALHRAKPDKDRGTVSSPGKSLTVVTPPLVDRAIDIFEDVLRHATANGWRWRVVKRPDDAKKDYYTRRGPYLRYATEIVVDAVTLELSIEEKLRLVRRKTTAADRAAAKWGFLLSDYRDEYHPTGSLIFHIHGIEGTGARQRWKDSPTGKLESKVGDIAKGLLAASRVHKQREDEKRLKRERLAQEERRRTEEAERLRRDGLRSQHEAARVRHLVGLANDHETAQRIRSLVQAATDSVRFDAGIQEWARWAEQVADDMDPVVPTQQETALDLATPDFSKMAQGRGNSWSSY